MIIGIGTDIVTISRIANSVERQQLALAERILTERELSVYMNHAKPIAFLAKRFAAKEAASKALGTGIGKISWQDLEISNDSDGAPKLECRGKAKARLESLGANQVHISISDERDTAVAFVVISRG